MEINGPPGFAERVKPNFRVPINTTPAGPLVPVSRPVTPPSPARIARPMPIGSPGYNNALPRANLPMPKNWGQALSRPSGLTPARNLPLIDKLRPKLAQPPRPLPNVFRPVAPKPNMLGKLGQGMRGGAKLFGKGLLLGLGLEAMERLAPKFWDAIGFDPNPDGKTFYPCGIWIWLVGGDGSRRFAGGVVGEVSASLKLEDAQPQNPSAGDIRWFVRITQAPNQFNPFGYENTVFRVFPQGQETPLLEPSTCDDGTTPAPVPPATAAPPTTTNPTGNPTGNAPNPGPNPPTNPQTNPTPTPRPARRPTPQLPPSPNRQPEPDPTPQPQPLPEPQSEPHKPPRKPRTGEQEGDCDPCALLDDILEELEKQREQRREPPRFDVIEVPYAVCTGESPNAESAIRYMSLQVVSPPRNWREIFTESAELGLKGCECGNSQPVASVPDWWQVRLGGERPQLAIVFRWGTSNSYSTLHIPHPVSTAKPENSPLPAYRKGNWQGQLTLMDNSKFTVNAVSAEEAQRVINAAIAAIKPSMVGSDPRIHIGQRKGVAVKEGDLIPARADYYPTGQKNMKPEWRKRFGID